MSEQEIWKDVFGYEGLYKVSNKGNVHSVARKNSRGNKCGGLILKLGYNRQGYLRVTLCKNGKKQNKLVHRLVAEAFLSNPKKFPDVNHRDEDKTNNELSNLEWCDTSYNINYGSRNKKVSQKLSKRVRAVNIETGEVLTFRSTMEAGKKGYDRVNVGSACRKDYRGRKGKLIGGGNLYRNHRWSYE